MLRFVVNHTYRVQPGGSGQLEENVFLRYKANSIYDVIDSDGSQNQPATFVSQNSAQYPTGVVNADGYDQWSSRYFSFLVKGSKCQVTFEPIGPNSVPPSTGSTAASKVIAPSTFYINLAGGDTVIQPTTTTSQLMALPYTRRAGIICQRTTTNASGDTNSIAGSKGARLFMTYSASKFEGVNKLALSADATLKGAMAGNPASPQEKSYYTIGIRPTVPNSLSPPQLSPSGIMRVKIEYAVLLTEPTSTNYVQNNAGANWPFS
jgi:hypothetical protein